MKPFNNNNILQTPAMSNASQKRIARELQEVAKRREVAECGLTLELVRKLLESLPSMIIIIILTKYSLHDRAMFALQVGSCLTSLVGSVTGPPDTPYHGGTYRLEITIPEDYPFSPPRVAIAQMSLNIA